MTQSSNPAEARGAEAPSLDLAQTQTTSSDALYWQERALDAEDRADRAVRFVRSGLTPHLARLMKDQLVWTLRAQRNEMVSAHGTATSLMTDLVQRLEQIQTDFESRVGHYEQRIAELERELESRKEINRELIAARIEVTRKALHCVAVRHPDSPFARKWLLPESTPSTSVGRHRGLSFRDILARRASAQGS